jgi:tetratricopeptide (TPR) repeat protein
VAKADGSFSRQSRGDVEVFQRAVSALDANQYESAASLFSDSINSGDRTYESLLGRSNAYTGLKEYGKALVDVTRAIDLNPQNPYGYIFRASIYGKLNQVKEAIADATRAISLNPDKASYYRYRGAAYLAADQPINALNDLTKAIELGEREAAVYENRGLANARLTRYHDAVIDLSHALDLDSHSVGVLIQRGTLFMCLGDVQKALNDFNDALKQTPDAREALGRRAWAYLEIHDNKAALEDLKQAVRKGSNDSWILLNLGYELFREGHFLEALEVNQKLVDNDKLQNSEAYFQRGLFLLSTGKTGKAQEAYNQGVRLAKNEGNGGVVQDAIEELKQLLENKKVSVDIIQKILKRLEETKLSLTHRGNTGADQCQSLFVRVSKSRLSNSNPQQD